MESEDHADQAVALIADTEASYPAERHRDLANALYTFSELGLWKMDIDIKGIEEAIRVWAVVEKVRRDGFPEELRM